MAKSAHETLRVIYDISLSVAVSLLPKVESVPPVLHHKQIACAGIINVSTDGKPHHFHITDIDFRAILSTGACPSLTHS